MGFLEGELGSVHQSRDGYRGGAGVMNRVTERLQERRRLKREITYLTLTRVDQMI